MVRRLAVTGLRPKNIHPAPATRRLRIGWRFFVNFRPKRYLSESGFSGLTGKAESRHWLVIAKNPCTVFFTAATQGREEKHVVLFVGRMPKRKYLWFCLFSQS
ncbi:MAG: hypothetical protein MUD08_02655 [Cytophagales bacterium]|nr:hypothetical protein [Cytophagales bacterium]